MVACFLVAMALGLSGCVTGQARLTEGSGGGWRDRGRVLPLLEERLRAVHLQPGADVAVGVTDDGLIGQPLSGGTTWSFPHPISGRPSIAGGVVVTAGGGEIFALKASTGELLWKRPSGGAALVGAGDDGSITVVTLESASGEGWLLLAVDRDGHVVRQLESDRRLGRPTAVAGLSLVPWSDRFIIAYDTISGDVLARIPLEAPVTAAFALSDTIYFGGVSAARFDEKLAAAPSKALFVSLPDREPFGGLRLLPRPSDERAPVAGPSDKVRAFARLTPRGQPFGLQGAQYVATYYRLVAGLWGDGAVRWVRGHDSDFVGGAVFEGGIALCDLAGRVIFLEQEGGQETAQLALGQPLRSCVVSADGLRRAPSGRAAPRLADQIAEVLALPSPDIAPAQAWLLDVLGALDDPWATRALIDVAQDPDAAPALQPGVLRKLGARRNGAEHMLAALAKTPDFLHDVPRSPPVVALAPALSAMGDRRAGPLLVRQLLHPATPSPAVRAAATALVELASVTDVADLETFFSLNRGIL